MTATPTDPILREFRSGLEHLYGDRLARIVLFGSRARGDARDDSDYDVAVFIHDMQDRWAEFDRLNPLVTDILFGRGAFVHALPYSDAHYAAQTPLMHEIRLDGVEI